jgi:hypothetical protein
MHTVQSMHIMGDDPPIHVPSKHFGTFPTAVLLAHLEEKKQQSL